MMSDPIPRPAMDAAIEAGVLAIRDPCRDDGDEAVARAVIEASLPHLTAGKLPPEPSEEAVLAASDTLTGKALFLHPEELRSALRAAYCVDYAASGAPPSTCT